MDCKTIQDAVQKWLYECNHHYQALNYGKTGYHEADVLGITLSKLVTEVEVKISLSYFKADFRKKHKHHRFSNPKEDGSSKVPNRFYYACPAHMIKEVPAYAGLLYIDKLGNLEVIKVAPMLHKVKADDKLMIGMLQNLTAKTIFGCQYMTYKNKEKQKWIEANYPDMK
jgi:hypothetical protein